MSAVIEPCEQIPNVNTKSLKNYSDTQETEFCDDAKNTDYCHNDIAKDAIKKQSEATLNKADRDGSLFKSMEDLKTNIARIFYGNLYLIGQIWINALQAVLVGAKLKLVPTVEASSVHAVPIHAAKVYTAPIHAASVCVASNHNCPCTEPEKPAKMRYSDLPCYDGPHKVYKDQMEARSDSPQSSTKILHTMTLPYVTVAREAAQKYICATKCRAKTAYWGARSDMENAHKKIMHELRDENNLRYRRGIVLSTATLCCVAAGKGIAKRIFWTSFGATTSGMICFPKETDVTIREFLFYGGNGIVKGYNEVCSRAPTWLRQKGKCKTDYPEEPNDKSCSVYIEEDDKKKK